MALAMGGDANAAAAGKDDSSSAKGKTTEPIQFSVVGASTSSSSSQQGQVGKGVLKVVTLDKGGH